MKKYFISSDIHSFFDEWQHALKKKGFDIDNPEHIIVLIGDIFDRGKKSLEVYNFIKSLPKERRILIRGNHEILLRDLCTRRYAEIYDYTNGTVDTIYQLNEWDDDKETHDYYKGLMELGEKYTYDSPEVKMYEHNHGIRNKRYKLYSSSIMLEVLNWIASDEWVNYWETSNYIFVHSWIPVLKHYDWEKTRLLQMPVKTGPDTYREDWRNATDTEWEDATWGCPWQKAKENLNETGKTIVCGHWHTSDFYNHLTKQKKDVYNCPIFKSKKYKLIGLDACTAGSHKVNVLVLNEDEM